MLERHPLTKFTRELDKTKKGLFVRKCSTFFISFTLCSINFVFVLPSFAQEAKPLTQTPPQTNATAPIVSTLVPSAQQDALDKPAPAALTKEAYDALFRKSLANPADLDAAFKFAEAANSFQDYEAAIGALERMLFFNPNLPRVRLELGVLYFKLGAYAQARSYFTSAINAPDAPEDIKHVIQGYLAEIDKRDSPSQFAGSLQFGARMQTNGNAAPSNSLVRVFGLDATLDASNLRQRDWNDFALGNVRYVYDLGTQRGDTIETSVQFYAARQAKLQTLNVSLIELQTGPRFALPIDALPNLSAHPYVITNMLQLNGANYLSTTGAGLSFAVPVQFVQVEVGSEYRRRYFYTSPTYTTTNQQTGNLKSVFTNVQVPVWGGIKLQARGAYAANHTIYENAFYAYTSPSVDGGFSYEFAPLLLANAHNWTVTPTVGKTWTRYYQANPLIDPSTSRGDRERHASVTFDAPITDNLGFSAQVQYIRNDSNLPNYAYRNFIVTFGPTGRF